MFVGCWSEKYFYSRGDIVHSIGFSEHYYICEVNHDASADLYPSNHSRIWLRIDKRFLESLSIPSSNNGTDAGILFAQTRAPVASVQEPEHIDMREPPSEDTRKRTGVKRKIQRIEKSLEDWKRRKVSNDVDDMREQLMLLNVDVPTKAMLIDKYDRVQKLSGVEYTKGMTWLNTVANIPYGKYKEMDIKAGDAPEKIQQFFKDVKAKMDSVIYGLEDVKQEILEFVARKVTNPNGKGEVLALCGPAGVGKTKIITCLADALGFPFYQINCGGINDVAVLTGHSETYVGSKPGKIAEIMQSSEYMNPIIYFDEIDKIAERKETEINGVLTHLLDEEQNSKFQDNYLSNVPINLSKVFYVIAFNDINRVDEIVSDRMKIVYVGKPSLEQKVEICQQKVIPDIMKCINFNKNVCVDFTREMVEYIIMKKAKEETGIRQLKKCIEKVLNRLNFDILTSCVPSSVRVCEGDGQTKHTITAKYIDGIVKGKTEDDSYLSMYI
jgi:ATP-dependent Lon protease